MEVEAEVEAERRCGVEVDEDVDDGIFGWSQPEEETLLPSPAARDCRNPDLGCVWGPVSGQHCRAQRTAVDGQKVTAQSIVA